MTAKEKAKELVQKYRGFCTETEEMNQTTAKQCALICIDEIIEGINRLNFACHIKALQNDILYWEQVKTEIQNL